MRDFLANNLTFQRWHIYTTRLNKSLYSLFISQLMRITEFKSLMIFYLHLLTWLQEGVGVRNGGRHDKIYAWFHWINLHFCDFLIQMNREKSSIPPSVEDILSKSFFCVTKSLLERIHKKEGWRCDFLQGVEMFCYDAPVLQGLQLHPVLDF